MLSTENELLDNDLQIIPSKSSIFLMDLDQLRPDYNASEELSQDLTEFLGLVGQLPKLHDRGKKHFYHDRKRQRNFINICDNHHREVRKTLLNIGKKASLWIHNYFLLSTDVIVSSRERFIKIIEDWEHDPCEHINNV